MSNLLQDFLNSPFGSQAVQALQSQHALPPEKAQQAIGVVTAGAQDMMQKNEMDPNAIASQFGTLGNAAAGGIGGMLNGGGVRGAIEGGIGGMVAGKAAEILAQKVGMDPRTASSVAAVAAPFLLRFLHEHLQGQSEQPAQPPINMPNMPNMKGAPEMPMNMPPNMSNPKDAGNMQGMPNMKGGANLPQMPYDQQPMQGNGKAPMAPGAKDAVGGNSQKGDNLAPWKRFL